MKKGSINYTFLSEMKEFKGERCLPRLESNRLEHGNHIFSIQWNSTMLGVQKNPDVFKRDTKVRCSRGMFKTSKMRMFRAEEDKLHNKTKIYNFFSGSAK